MNTDAARADRMQSIRDAAREWARAGWIDESARRRIDEKYPDDRHRAGLAFRVLFFVLTLGALMAATGIIYASSDSWFVGATFAFVVGCAGAALTSSLLGSMKRRQGGIEAASSVYALLNLVMGLVVFLLHWHGLPENQASMLVFLFCAVLTAGAAWVWGYWPYASISAACLFLVVAPLPAGRLLWVAVALLLCKPLISGWDSARLPPALRKSCAAFLAVSLVGAYVAINTYSLDQKLTDFLFIAGSANAQFLPRSLSIVLTGLVPPVIVVAGIASRRRVFLNLGFFLSLLSLTTLRFYVHVAPAWLVLTGAGLLLFASATVLRQSLNSGVGGVRGGFTAQPLMDDPGKRRLLEILAGVATLTPGTATDQPKPQFQGGGGKFGGGGASAEY